MLDKISHKIVPTFNQKVELSGTFAGEPFVFSVTLLGQQYPQYLILGLGYQARWEKVLPAIKESENLRLKLISDEGEMIAAHVSLIHATHFPEKLLFMSYPEQGIARSLRQSPRVGIDYPAQLQVANHFPYINGSIVDIGRGGMGFETTQQLPSMMSDLCDRDVKLHIGKDDQQRWSLSGRIRLLQEHRPNVWHVGIKCELSVAECEEVLYHLVSHQNAIDRLINNDQSNDSYSNNTLQV